MKASCTLDASIKIYSYRVDDTYATSYRVLENLNRTEQRPCACADWGLWVVRTGLACVCVCLCVCAVV
jgi:Condensin complex subunit 2